MSEPPVRVTVTRQYEGAMLDTSIVTNNYTDGNSHRTTFVIDTTQKGNEFEVVINGEIIPLNKLEFTLVGSIESDDFLYACKDYG